MQKILVLGTGQMGKNYIKNLVNGLNIEPGRIVGVDFDGKKLEDLAKEFPEVQFVQSKSDRPLNEFVDFDQVGSVFLTTNTPSHHRLLVELMDNGVRKIFCEKPLALNMDGVDEIRKTKMRTGADICTAFLMNFSNAVNAVTEMMRVEELVLIQGEASWGKNRMYDSRPTPGDLEDESVHPIGVFHTLLRGSEQQIQAIYVAARLSWLDYIDPEVQRMAHEADASFPLNVNSSSFINEELHSSGVPFPILLHTSCSFVKGKQVRRVECVLAQQCDPRRPAYALEFNFDVKRARVEKGVPIMKDGRPLTYTADLLEVTKLEGNVVYNVEEFECNKVESEAAAFMKFVDEGIRDPRLTGYLEARMSVKVTDAVIRSDQAGGNVVQAFGEEDIKLRQAIGW